MFKGLRSLAWLQSIGLALIWLQVCLANGACALAQTELSAAHVPAGPGLTNPDPAHSVIRASASLVLVPVSVTDPRERLVTGLSPENFQIFENGKRQEIKHFSSEDAPVSLGILVDLSGSMAGKIERAREAVKEFCDSANPQDEFFLITFSEEPRLIHDFTSVPEEIQGELALEVPRGRTSLLDAVYLGVRQMRRSHFARRALLIISDGGDNHSRYSERDVKSAIKESDVAVYSIGIFDRRAATQEEALGPELLTEVAGSSGGRAFFLDNLKEMPGLAHRIGVELRTQYLLGYRPAHPPDDGKWHKITVKLKIPRSFPYLRATAKEGYYASP
jgi:Ca-activated chloride channel family protein